jgi:glutamate N-acetyltransferase/amino-acid N-acetyltransferase
MTQRPLSSFSVSDAPIAVPGFRFASAAAGIKVEGRLDVAAIVADEPANIAAVFTRNCVQAAPVRLAKTRVRSGKASAVLVNSGNANACTGKAGLEAARATTLALAERLGVRAEAVIPASTGVIGALLPADKIIAATDRLCDALSSESAMDFARAIMTTDQWPKIASVTMPLARGEGRVLGIAKGAGMIHPNMATTLAFVVTDIGADSKVLQRMLRSAISTTFNAISVDGDTSTNDTVLLLSSGRAGRVRADSTDAKRFQEAVTAVLDALGRSIVRDGEGARHVARIEVSGLPSDRAARQVAQTIATSPLVKTALHGRDANWGRILAAAGRAGVPFQQDRAELRIGDETIVRNGMPVGRDAEQRAARILAEPEYTIHLSLGQKKGRAHYLTNDLGPDYIAVNANYRS